MEPYDKNLISLVKKNLKQIGSLSLPLCRDNEGGIEDAARNINKIAHESYELIWLAENSAEKEISMKSLNEKGVTKFSP